MKINYSFKDYILYKNNIIYIDFCKYGDYVETFEILEVFSYLLFKYQGQIIEQIIINGNEKLKIYLEEIGFLYNLNYYLGIRNINIPIFSNKLLNQMKIFLNKNEFYGLNQKIIDVFFEIGLSNETSYLVLSSLGEIIDNSFFHNLGRWQTKIGPFCLFLAQNESNERKLSFIITDLGIGFSNTLKDNYPGLKTEKEYIEIALKPGITGRYQKKGGNGLVYLQKNIFNGFAGELYIRSNKNLVKVESFRKVLELNNNIDITGVSIMFILYY